MNQERLRPGLLLRLHVPDVRDAAAEGELIVVSAADGGPATAAELLETLGPDAAEVSGVGKNRLKFADGREAWRIDGSWRVGTVPALVESIWAAD